MTLAKVKEQARGQYMILFQGLLPNVYIFITAGALAPLLCLTMMLIIIIIGVWYSSFRTTIQKMHKICTL